MKNILKIFLFFTKKERMRRSVKELGKSVIPLGNKCDNCPYLQISSIGEGDVWYGEQPNSFCWFVEKEKSGSIKICGK